MLFQVNTDELNYYCVILNSGLKRNAMYNKVCNDLHLGSGNMCNVLSPGSVLLSANGTMAFKSCPRYEDMASFTAPEVQQGHAATTRTAIEKVGQNFSWSRDTKPEQNVPSQSSGNKFVSSQLLKGSLG